MTRPVLDRLDLTAIAVGGTIGAAARWLVTRNSGAAAGGWFEYGPNTTASFEPNLPWRTLLVNLVGCLVLGALTQLFTRPELERHRRLLVGLATGFCGSLTTFSTFAVEVAELLGARATGDVATGLAYVGLSLAGGAAAFGIGRIAARPPAASGAVR